MKTVAGILALVLIVGVVAVGGSRAQPLPATSVAFRQCLDASQRPDGRCVPVTVVPASDEFGVDRDMQVTGDAGWGDYGSYDGNYGYTQGDNLSSPDLWREIAWAAFTFVASRLIDEALKWAENRLFGNAAVPGDLTAARVQELFDPVR